MVENLTTDQTNPRNTSSDEITQSTPPSDETCELVSKTVKYSNRSDRCTIFPPDLSGIARMEQWISADAQVFVDLEVWR